MYECKDLYLYEIIEDYKDAETTEEKEDIFLSFCSLLWSCDNKRRLYTKRIHFRVRKDLRETPLGKIFETWNDIEYQYYKSLTKDTNWCSIIRQKINNLYTRHFDSTIILSREYMSLIKTPKQLYCEWIAGSDMKEDVVTQRIADAIDRSEKLKLRLQAEKMSLSWTEYKQLIEEFLRRCFDTCQRIEEYETSSLASGQLDLLTEDHFYIRYIHTCLEGELLKWQKKYYGVRRGKNVQYKRCRLCQRLIEYTGNKKMYCKACAALRKRQSNQASKKACRQKGRKIEICSFS